jgi:hypothetical protein
MGDERRLSHAEVQLVLRRAAELEAHRDDDEHGLSPAELEALAADVGLSSEAVRRALGELQAGALAPPQAPGALERVLGPRQLIAERIVPGSVPEVNARVERLLRAQLMRKQRDFGERAVWQHAPGWLPQLRRSLDWSGQFGLNEVQTLEVALLDAGNGNTTVRLGADVGALQRKVLAGTALGTAVGIAAALLLAAAQMPHALEWVAAAGSAGTGTLAFVRAYRREVQGALTALERLLDEIAANRPPPSALDVLFAR